MADDDLGGCIGAVVVIVGAVIALYLIFVWIIPATVVLGATFGGFVAGRNYIQSFLKNVRPETDPNGILAKCIVGLVFALVASGIVALIMEGATRNK